jgi:predicted N-formylglutamate amidohydrolase
VLTCEHASNRLPLPLRASPTDRAWLATHWGWDIGAATVATRLAVLVDAPLVLSTVSRLVIDLNRPLDSDTLILPEVEGVPLDFNRALTPEDRGARIAAFHRPYHAAVDTQVGVLAAQGGPALLFSVHSFTPNYMGERREMEMGVLFDDHEDRATVLAASLQDAGWRTRLNEPWSGRNGLVYAPHRHGTRHSVPYLELEIRQDLIADFDGAIAVAERLAGPLRALLQG